ncbi:MAG: hypothetical protein CMF59_08745 [Leptospiraceae bacterium]|nr:hypothetical protein [Leptospiraceae bacterium]
MIQGPDWRPDFPLQSRPQSRVQAADREVTGVLASSWAIHKLIQGKARGKPSLIAEGEGARNSLDRASFTTLNGCRAFPTGSCARMENPGYKGKNSVFFCTSELADIESRRLWPQTS